MKYCIKCKSHDHPMYNVGTLFFMDGSNKGLIIVQKRFNADSKVMWYGPIDSYLTKSIGESEHFDTYFNENAREKDSDGHFPTYHLRSVMHALHMKPIPKADWEKF